MDSLEHVKYGCLTRMREINYKTEFSDEKMRYTFFFYSKIQKQDYQGCKKNEIPDSEFEVNIPGLLVFHDFVTKDEEEALVAKIDSEEWHRLKKRRVQHYGYEFIYGKNAVDPEQKIGPLPEWLEPSLGKMNAVCHEYNGTDTELDQLTINEYFPGQGIPPHVDSHEPFKEAFAVLSLLGGVVMNFKNHKG